MDKSRRRQILVVAATVDDANVDEVERTRALARRSGRRRHRKLDSRRTCSRSRAPRRRQARRRRGGRGSRARHAAFWRRQTLRLIFFMDESHFLYGLNMRVGGQISLPKFSLLFCSC